MKKSGTRMVMIDEFQHFYDRGKRQIMHNVADWLKVLIDDTRTMLVVAGLVLQKCHRWERAIGKAVSRPDSIARDSRGRILASAANSFAS